MTPSQRSALIESLVCPTGTLFPERPPEFAMLMDEAFGPGLKSENLCPASLNPAQIRRLADLAGARRLPEFAHLAVSLFPDPADLARIFGEQAADIAQTAKLPKLSAQLAAIAEAERERALLAVATRPSKYRPAPASKTPRL